RNDGSGIDSLIEVMDRRADVLRLAIHERPEIGARAAIVRREAEMQVDDAALECRQQGLSKNAGAEDENDVGPRRGHQRNFSGIAARAACDDAVYRTALHTHFGVSSEVSRLGVVPGCKMALDDLLVRRILCVAFRTKRLFFLPHTRQVARGGNCVRHMDVAAKGAGEKNDSHAATSAPIAACTRLACATSSGISAAAPTWENARCAAWRWCSLNDWRE